jgi:hypothetical protein
MEYRPPSETLPIFDSSVFRNRNASLTFDEAKKYFLEWPRAQGPETLQETTIIGALTCSSTATFGTAGSADNIPTCISDYSTISSADSSSKIPTTSWVQTAITSGGGGGTLLQQVILPAVANEIVLIEPPVGTYTCVLEFWSGGGSQGPDNINGDTITTGGSGGAGSYYSITINMTGGITPPFMYYIFGNDNQEKVGWYVDVYWDLDFFNTFRRTLPVLLDGTPINTIVNMAGASGYDFYEPSLGGHTGDILGPSGTECISVNYALGMDGVDGVTFPLSTTIYNQPQCLNAMGVMNENNAITSAWSRGESSSYVNGVITKTPRGNGGAILSYYS